MNYSMKEIAINKLIILLILKEIDMPLTRGQLTNIVLENNLINYFDFQQCIQELEKTNFISILEKSQSYSITKMGIRTLDVFASRIPNNTIEQIIKYIKKNKASIILETQVHASFTKQSETEYIVELKVIENDIILIELKLNVVSSKQANIICEQWKKSYHLVYDSIMNTLAK